MYPGVLSQTSFDPSESNKLTCNWTYICISDQFLRIEIEHIITYYVSSSNNPTLFTQEDPKSSEWKFIYW